MRETDVAAPVVEYLRGTGWDVYQEIEPWSGGGIADIVAQRHGLIWIVECKTTLGLAVLGQAWDWSHAGAAHYVSVAVPRPRRTSGSDNVLTHILSHAGIGVLRVDPDRFYQDARDVREWHAPRLNRWARRTRSYRRIRACLTDKTRDYAEAGNANGKRWTPFQETCDRIRSAVRRRGSMTLRALVEDIEHHYQTDSTAKSALRQWLRAGSIRGVRLDESVKPAVVALDAVQPQEERR